MAECGTCREGELAFDGARTFGLYAGKLRKVVLRLKFAGDERLGARLGELLGPSWDSLEQTGEWVSPLIVPVPLHPSRQRERGFNQSEHLAAGLVRALRSQSAGTALQIDKACLRRTRATRPQTGLSVTARRQNLRAAFEVIDPRHIRARVIVLVDDVMTTGATFSACARTLKRAGALRVFGLALARATPHFPDLGSDDGDNPVDGLGGDST